MEAALWSRVENVKVLLNANADKLLRDNKGCRAIDLARLSPKNEKEVYQRCYSLFPEMKPEADQDRRYIVLLLSNTNTEKLHRYTGPLAQGDHNNYRFQKSQSESTIRLLGPIGSWPVSSISKTAAVLDRGNQFSRITATSGWNPNALPLDDPTMPTWIEQVFYIASTIGHEMSGKPDWDAGHPGKHYASHAEKKLIAYFMDRHVLLRQDKEHNEELQSSIREKEAELKQGEELSESWANVCDLEKRKIALSDQLIVARNLQQTEEVKRLKREIHAIIEELAAFESDPYVFEIRATKKELRILQERGNIHYQLMNLRRIEPPISLKQAVILSSNKICDDCGIFKKKVNDFLNLEIEMHWCLI
ncbi:DYW family of nucleic acid deaminases-domain-containing protein [Xylariaceae sp. FL0594]|nr:DYW family of nucleic acid deaminases-domain-containing protein [Xylariaceae sp. FL0594]